MIDELTLRLLSDKLRDLAHNRDRDDAEGEAAVIEYTLTGGTVDSEGNGDTELLIAYLALVSTGEPNGIPAESHAAFRERLALNPRVLSAVWRQRVRERISASLRGLINEIPSDFLATLFVRVDDATCRYLCISTAIIFDDELKTNKWLSGEQIGVSTIDTLIERATSDELNARVYVSDLTETLLELWTQSDLSELAEAALLHLVRSSYLVDSWPPFDTPTGCGRPSPTP